MTQLLPRALEPWSRDHLLELAAASGWEMIDLSQSLPMVPPPELADAAGTDPTRPAGYPPSAGSQALREAFATYLARRFGVAVPSAGVAACTGAKEFLSTTPLLLRQALGERAAKRDTALIPALGYLPYEFGSHLAGLRTYRMPVDDELRIDLAGIPDDVAARALYLWVNSPTNPTGIVEKDLVRLVRWARDRGVIVLADEAYAELVWRGRPETVLSAGLDGVLAVHSVSKRSNAPGLRVGFYAGDPALMQPLVALRREVGLMSAEHSQEAAVRLLHDDAHARHFKERMRTRLFELLDLLEGHGLSCVRPAGGMFVWAAAPGGDGVAFASEAAMRAGLVVSPGRQFGPSGYGHIRVAASHRPAVIGERLAILRAAGSLG